MIAIVVDANGVDYIRQARVETPGVATSIHYVGPDKRGAKRLAEVFEDIHSKCISETFSDQKRKERIIQLGKFFTQNSEVAIPVIIGTDNDNLSDFWANARVLAEGSPIVYQSPELQQTATRTEQRAQKPAQIQPSLRPALNS